MKPNKSRIALLLAFCMIAFSFSYRKHKKVIPPGTVQITENFFADIMEIDNQAWHEYEIWTRIKFGKNSPEHIATIPDTMVWRNKMSFNEPYVEYYYRHPAYKNYPVVGISYEQAQAFCKWRTLRVKEFYCIGHKKELNIEYRLPSREEWEFISINGLGALNNGGKDDKGKPLLNIIGDVKDTAGGIGFMKDNADVTAPVKSYDKNLFGLYNLFGNVAEMISEKGISKGGSWRHHLEDCRSGKSIPYSKPEAWLGFRCVCKLNNKDLTNL